LPKISNSVKFAVEPSYFSGMYLNR